jgi:hypothetical protein
MVIGKTKAPPAPSTEWSERIEHDEAERFERYAQMFTRIQAERSSRWGDGRALHRKQLAAAHGTLEVLGSLPPFARHGLFAKPRIYEARVRLSNGGFDHAHDKVPDIRGFALRVLGVQGKSALGGAADAQDFTLINQEAFAFAKSEEFVAFAVAASQGNAALFRHIVKRYGLLGAPVRVGKMVRALKRSFTGFATEKLYSAVPMANGPYAVRVRLVPADSNGPVAPDAHRDWSEDFRKRLLTQPLHWDLQLQYFARESLTPIEDASVVWPTPYSTVARLMLPRQDMDSDKSRELARELEGSAFDPWHALADHRPLGEVQRARKIVYLASQRQRGAA